MTARKRATGFALMDAAFAADAKFLKLYRLSRTPRDYAAAVGVFWIILADARRNKDADVDWDEYRDYKAQLTALRQVGLLTGSGFDRTVFDRWAPAYRSPHDRQRGYATVRNDTQGYTPSVQVSSNGGRGPGEGMAPLHDGSHANCLVCEAVKSA